MAYVGVVVAGFGAIAGVLGYLALRLGRGR
ncbi:MAG: small membrane protein MtfM [Micromonosporaceae bacterium]